MNKQHEKIISVYDFIKNQDVQSINHISKELKLNWRTVKSYLDLFDKLKVDYTHKMGSLSGENKK